jgi:ribosomal protein S12 methylthiotransferase
VDRGVREISLIAQDSSHYGRDLGLLEGLADLLEALDAVPGLRWIRVHYLYPTTLTPRMIEALARLPRVVKYADLPLQHAHPATLRRMRRGGSGQDHLRLLERLRAAMPEGALRSTFIVGFPGEDDEEFRALLDFVAAARLDHVGVFTYSHEDGTTARALPDDVPPEVKEERRGALMELQRGIVLERQRRLLGRVVETLVEGAHPETEHLLVGRMSTQALEVDGQILIQDGFARAGEFVAVELTETAGYDLVRRIVRGP